MNERKKIFLQLFISALSAGLAVAFSKYLGFIICIALIPLVMALRSLSKREDIKLKHAYLYGLFYFEIFYSVCFHFFFYLYPLDFTGLNNFESVLVVIVATFGLSFLQALFGGLVFVLTVIISKTSAAKKYPLVNVLSMALIYPFYEFTQTLGWWGVPWGRLSLALTDMLFPVQTASLFGSYFITFVIVITNSLLAFSVMKAESVSSSRRYAAAALTIFSLNFLSGVALFFTSKLSEKDNEKITVGVIQGNYDSADKWTVTIPDILDKHIKLTEDAANDGAEIVVWAETALPITLYENSMPSLHISMTAEELGITIIVGAMSREDGNQYNTLFAFMPDGTVNETKYYKRHLVPFGEYVPMRSFFETALPFLSEISMLNDDMVNGYESNVFEFENATVGSLICFDSIYESLTRDTVNDGAELIVLSTNDSWFSTSAAIYIHNNQARMRAVESGRYIARSANTGLSSFITSRGEMLSSLPLKTEDHLCESLKLSNRKTLYTVIGNSFVYVCGILIFTPLSYDLFEKIKASLQSKNAQN